MARLPKTDPAFDEAVASAAAQTGAQMDIPGTEPTGSEPDGNAAPVVAAPAPARRGPGRPPGSGAQHARSRRPATRTSDAPRVITPVGISPEDARTSAAFMLKYLDRVAVQVAGTPPLSEDELKEGADAFGPIVQKYTGTAMSPEMLAVVWVAGAYGPRAFAVVQARRRGVLPAPVGSDSEEVVP